MSSVTPAQTSQVFLNSTLMAVSPCLMLAPGTLPTVPAATQFLRSDVAAQRIVDHYGLPGDLHSGHAMTRFYDSISSPPESVSGIWKNTVNNLYQAPITTLDAPLTALADALDSAATFSADRMVDGLVTCVGGGVEIGRDQTAQNVAASAAAAPSANSKTLDPDSRFSGIMSTDYSVKSFTDGLLAISVGLSAYVKNAGNSAAALFADHFYHPSNPLFWLMPKETRETPLSEDAKNQILQWSGMPDFFRTPLVAFRYALNVGRLVLLRRDVKKEQVLPADRQKTFELKVTGEALRATFTIADFSAVMVASGLMRADYWQAAAATLVASHVARSLTAISTIATTPVTLVDAKRTEAHNKAKAEAENEEYKPQTIPIVVRSVTLMGVGFTMLATEAFVAGAALTLLSNGAAINEMVATLKSSSVSMPLPVSLTLGTVQALGTIYGVYRNAPHIGKTTGKERKSYIYGTCASALQAVASFAYAIPQYFSVGALISAFASFGFWRQIINQKAAKAAKINPPDKK